MCTYIKHPSIKSRMIPHSMIQLHQSGELEVAISQIAQRTKKCYWTIRKRYISQGVRR